MRDLALLGLAAALTVLAAGCKSTASEPPATPAAAKAAPEIQAAYWLNSGPLTLAGLRGKIVVLEFWATWCPPCKRSIPHLVDLHKRYGERGVAIVSLTDEARETVEPFAKELGMTYAVGGGSKSVAAYDVTGIPHAFLIDPSGAIAWEGHPLEGLDEALEAQLKKTPPRTGGAN